MTRETPRVERPAHDIVLVPHDPAWSIEFERESKVLGPILGRGLVGLHHVGSTAVPGILAKPVIDMLAMVEDLSVLEVATRALEATGYEAMGEFGLPGRRYFRRTSAAGVRTHQLHGYQADAHDGLRMLAFRDLLRRDPATARAYSDLKARLAAAFRHDMDGYSDGKTELIRQVERRAMKELADLRARHGT